MHNNNSNSDSAMEQKDTQRPVQDPEPEKEEIVASSNQNATVDGANQQAGGDGAVADSANTPGHKWSIDEGLKQAWSRGRSRRAGQRGRSAPSRNHHPPISAEALLQRRSRPAYEDDASPPSSLMGDHWDGSTIGDSPRLHEISEQDIPTEEAVDASSNFHAVSEENAPEVLSPRSCRRYRIPWLGEQEANIEDKEIPEWEELKESSQNLIAIPTPV
jgi:hypothetical protein